MNLASSTPSLKPSYAALVSIRPHAAVAATRAAPTPVPGGDAAELEALPGAGGLRKRVRRGECLYNAGDPFRSLFIVRVGVLKRFSLTDDGVAQVTGFAMTREIIGLDGIATGCHQSSVVALEDSEVSVIPYAECQQQSTDSRVAQQLMLRLLGREIGRGHELMLMLGTMNAEQKLAAFLIDLSDRYGKLGYSRSQFLLRMTREDIGSYVGLKLETVSRLFSRFQLDGLIQVQGKSIAVLDMAALRQRSKVGAGKRSHPATTEVPQRMVA